jgi:hypothetical protein
MGQGRWDIWKQAGLSQTANIEQVPTLKPASYSCGGRGLVRATPRITEVEDQIGMAIGKAAWYPVLRLSDPLSAVSEWPVGVGRVQSKP